MCCSGSVYAWSIFVLPLKTEFGLTTAQTQIIFGFIIGIFSITMLFVGRLERRVGPKITASIGAVLFGSGYVLASFSGGSFFIIILGISILSGAGMGFGYITVLANLVKWFPHRKGLATGIAVAGFGSGAILLSQIVQPILSSGVTVIDIFRIIGISYGAVFLVSALALSAPPATGEETAGNPIKTSVLLKDRRFWTLFYTYFAGSFSGLMLIGNLKPIGLSFGVSDGAATMAIVLISLGNAAGRIIWGQIYDKIGGKYSVSLALSALSVLILILATGVFHDISFAALSLIIGLFYGANFVLYASEVSNIYGIYQLGIVYPILSLAYGISGITGPVVGGRVFDMTSQYCIPIVIAAVVCLTGLATYVLFMKNTGSLNTK